jgi:ficolin
LTKDGGVELKISMSDFSGQNASLLVYGFQISDEAGGYALSYNSTNNAELGGSLPPNGQKFSTIDRDNDTHQPYNCAQQYKGAWWYHNCHWSNLNGLYRLGKHESYADGVNWKHFRGHHYSLRDTELKIRLY